MQYIVRVLMAFCAILPAWGQTSPPDHPIPPNSSPQSYPMQAASSAGKWVQLGDGSAGPIYHMAPLNDEMYLLHSNNGLGNGTHTLSRWNGVEQVAIASSNVQGLVFCMGTYRGEIYLGGTFYMPDRTWVKGLVRWDGTRWQPVPMGMLKDYGKVEIWGMREFQGSLYCSGKFQKQNAQSLADVAGVVRFDGSEWSEAGNAPTAADGSASFPVGYSLEVYKGELYLSGAFMVNGVKGCVARWDGSRWYNVPGIIPYSIERMEVFDGLLYCYHSASDAPVILTWNGHTWNEVRAEFPLASYIIEDMIAYNGMLYTCGFTNTAASSGAVVRWDGRRWETVAILDNALPRLQVFRNRLYLGGDFVSVEHGSATPLKYFAMFCDDGLCGSISGMVFNDADGDCMHDEGEDGMRRHLVEILPGPLYAVTDERGHYTKALLPGTYTVNIIPSPHWNVTCPAPSGTHTVTVDADEAIGMLSFGVQADGNIRDMRVGIVAGPARNGLPHIYSLSYQNTGTVTTGGTVRLQLDPLLRFDSSAPAPARVLPSVLEWDFADLGPGEERNVKVWTTVPLTGQTGGEICSNIGLLPVSPFPLDEYDSICVDITGSFDPNDISVLPYGVEDDGLITPDDSVLTYRVRFQNTGNDTAFKVVVIDTVSNALDIRTIRLGAASHPYSFSIREGNILIWTFDNIMLPDSNASEPNSHGMFKYSVNLKPRLPGGTSIPNRVSIYFDYNAPVMTNTVTNIISNLLSVENEAVESDVAVFPNPVRGSMKITGEIRQGGIVTVQDLLGRTVLEQIYSGGEMTLDMSVLPEGRYFVKIPVRGGTVLRQANVVR